MKNICKQHQNDFSDIVACNDCNMISGYMLKNTQGAIFQMEEKPNLWDNKKSALLFAKKYAISKSWKPIEVYIHFN